MKIECFIILGIFATILQIYQGRMNERILWFLLEKIKKGVYLDVIRHNKVLSKESIKTSLRIQSL
jgi:hypothetical protein